MGQLQHAIAEKNACMKNISRNIRTEEDYLENLGVDGITVLKWNLNGWDVRVCSGFNRHRLKFSGGVL